MLLFQLFSLLLVRVPNPTGEFMTLQEISERYFKQFLRSHNHTVVVFEDHSYGLNFMNYAMFKFKNNISFVRTNYSSAKNIAFCESEPCIVGFNKDVPLSIGDPEYTQSGFALWCLNILNPRVYRIKYSKELRRLIKEESIQYIGVDTDERPSTIPTDKPFYSVPSSLLEAHDIFGATKGVYSYSHFDRQLVPYNGKTNNQPIFINIENLSTIQSTKPFLGGFIIDSTYQPRKEIEAIQNIFQKHTSKFHFFIGSQTTAEEIIKSGKLKKAKAPYFVALQTKNFSEGRYLIFNESRYDAKFLDDYLTRIENGNESFLRISAFLPDQSNLTFKEINSDNYHAIINDTVNDVLLAITAPWCHHCKQFKPVLNVVSRLFNESNVNIKLYWIDGTSNELPDDFPHYTGYPTMFLFRTTNKTSIEFDGDRTVPEIFTFMHENGSVNFTDPSYNVTEINAEIEQLRKNQ